MRKRRYKTTSTIDMSPLMDLTFMLLIIFVITVPSMYYKSDVTLTPPQMTTPEKMEVDEKSYVVELDKDGQIWIRNDAIKLNQNVPALADLTAELKKQKAEQGDILIFLIGDRERKYKEVMDIASAVQNAGFDSISLVFNPKGEGMK